MPVTECATQVDFQGQLVKSEGKLVVVDFTASWCGPCRMMKPIFEKMSEEYADMVMFLKVDVDVNQETSQEYAIHCMPTFIFIKNGKKVAEVKGADERKLRSKIDELKK